MVDVKNDMEHLVRQEVHRRKEASRDSRSFCWCPLCEADIVAFALNSLPPRYCRAANFGYAASQGFSGKVRQAVGLALDKVSKRPKHRPGSPDRYRIDASVEDYALRIGNALVGQGFVGAAGVCSCDGCRADVLALALNRYPPKYGVSTPGRPSYQEHFEDFIRHELGQAITKARQVVSANPNH